MATAIIAVVDDGSFSWHDAVNVDGGKLALSIFYSVLSLFIAFFLNIFLHEAGHLVFGLLTGFHFVSFRVFNHTFLKNEDGSWIHKKFSIPGTAGQCLMAPPTDIPAGKAPYFWYNAGGVIVNLLLATISIVCLKYVQLPMFLDCFFGVNACISIFIALMNGLPVKVGGTNNDGRNILELTRHPEKRADFIYQLSTAAEMSRGKRLCEMPAEWFPQRAMTDYADTISLGSKGNYIGWLEDCGRMDEAYTEVEELIKHKLPLIISREIADDVIFLRLVNNPDASIDDVWTKEQQIYTKAMAKYSASKERTFFILELLHDKQHDAALSRMEKLKENWQQFVFPGETRSVIASMEWVLERLDNNTINS